MITIIIAAHNMEKYIEEALDSILAQTYKNYELILVDDGSTDETFNIMQTYQVNKFINTNVTVINEKQSGIPAARNKAMPMAKGQYILFFDGEDVMMPDYLEQLVKCMEFEDVDMVVGDVIKIAENGSELTEAPRIYTKMHDGRYDTTYKIKDLMTLGDNIDGITGTKLYKSDIIFTNKLQFDGLNKYSDVTFFLKYLYFCSTVYVSNTALIKYRVSDVLVKSRASNKDLDVIACFRNIEDYVNGLLGGREKTKLFNYMLQNMRVKELSVWALHYTSPSASSRTLRKRLFKRFHREILSVGKKYYKYLSDDRKKEISEAKKRYHLRFWYLSMPYIVYKRAVLKKI